MNPIETVMRTSPVIPVLVIEDAAHARPIAEALVAGGLKVLEVTLRTPAALDAIREMKRVEGAIVGAGTVLNERQLVSALKAGSEFIVSPGLTKKLGRASIEAGVPYLPGVSNAADIMTGLDLGLNRFKFFPAATSGGLPGLKAMAAVFGDARFCPTGGVTADNAPEWLAEPAVLCVGGTWLANKGAPDVDAIRQKAADAARLGGGNFPSA